MVHSFYSWDKDKRGDHLTASFEQFIKSSHPARIVSAVEQAVKSCSEDFDLLCAEIIQIVWKHSLGRFILEFYFSIDLYIPDHSALAKTDATSVEQVGKVKNPTSAEAHATSIEQVAKVKNLTLTETHATSIEQAGKVKNPTLAETHAVKVKKTIPGRICGWFKHS